MKFLFTAPRFHTNQVPIVKGLIERGHEVRYFVAFCGAIEEHTYGQIEIIKPSFETLKKKKKLLKTKTESETESAIGGQFVPNYKDLKAKFKAYNPDVVICRDKTAFTLAANELCKKTNTPCILYDQEPLYKFSSNANKVVSTSKNSLIKRITNKIVAFTNTDRKINKKRTKKYGFPNVHITPVLTDDYKKYSISNKQASKGHNYYFPMAYESNLEISDMSKFKKDKIEILCVAKYREYKSHKVLVDAAALLENTEKIHIVFLGQCQNIDEKHYFQDLNNYITERKLDDCIELKKDINYHDMQASFRKYDILVLPSRRETYGMVIVEAMANGLCVIASSGCGAAFCIAEADGGAIFQNGNSKELSDVINFFIKNTGSIYEKGKNSYRYVKENMAVDSYIQVIKEVLLKEFNLNMESE